MKDRANIRIAAMLISLACTCFLTQCEACQKRDPVTKKILPGQLLYSISCGFPAPWLDVIVMTGQDDDFHYTAASPYDMAATAAVNIMALAGLFALLKLLHSRKLVVLNRLLAITAALAALFSLSLLAPYMPELVRSVALYLYIYPAGMIGSLFGYAGMEPPDNTLPPRIYLVALIVSLYFVTSLIAHARSLYKTGVGNA